MTTVAVKTVPDAEDFKFTYTDDINTSGKVLRLMRQQLDSMDLALIEEMAITYANGQVHTIKDPFLQGDNPADMEKLIATLNEIGVPYEADYADNFVTVDANASDKYVTIVFDEDGKFSFSI